MNAQLLSPQQLEGVYERVAIAEQTIRNLDSAISEFLKPLPSFDIKVDNGHCIVTQAVRDGWESIQKCAKETRIPLEFSIRAGEVIHHLRSCLDHIAWQLSDPAERETTRVQFPIIRDWTNPKHVAHYTRHTKLITNPVAQSIIQNVQPAGSNTPENDFLWIVHHMDIIDKHKELVLMLWVPRMRGPTSVTRNYAPIAAACGTPMLVPILGTEKVYANMKMSLNLTFAHFGRRENQQITKSLLDLTNRIREVIGMFAI